MRAANSGAPIILNPSEPTKNAPRKALRIALAAVLIACMAYLVGAVWRNSIAVDRIHNMGGWVVPLDEWPDWIPEGLGELLSYASGDVQIILLDVKLDDGKLQLLGRELRRFHRVRTLALSGDTVSDRWLKLIGPIKDVDVLILEETEITPAGCEELANWSNLNLLCSQGSAYLTEDSLRFLKTENKGLELYVTD